MGSEATGLLVTWRDRLLRAGQRGGRWLSVPLQPNFWEKLTLALKGFRQLATEVLAILLIAIAIILLVEEIRTPSIRISVVGVPDDLRSAGFTEEVATELINSELETIQKVAEVGGDGLLPWRDEQAIHFTIPGAGFGLGELAREIKRFFNVSDKSITVYVARSEGQLGFRLRSSNAELSVETRWRASKNEGELVDLAAEEIARATQPYVLASYYYARNRLKDCHRILTEIHRAYPPRTAMRAKAYDLSARILRDANSLDSALVEFEKAREHDATDTFILTNMGAVLSGMRRYDDAIKVYREAIELDDSDAASLMHLSNALYYQGYSDEAEETYRRAMKISSDDAIMLHNLSIALGERGKWDEAIAASTKAMELDFRTAAISNGLGYAMMNSKRPEEAVIAFERTLEIDPEFVFAWANLCIVYTDLRRIENARSACRSAKTLAPENPRVLRVVDEQVRILAPRP